MGLQFFRVAMSTLLFRVLPALLVLFLLGTWSLYMELSPKYRIPQVYASPPLPLERS